jgi:hypothetical protein
MTVIGALSSFRELGEMSPHKRACDLLLSLHCERKRTVSSCFMEHGFAKLSACSGLSSPLLVCR